MSKPPAMDVNQIMKLLPHRPPFLFVDKIIEISESHIIGLKNVTMNEDFFKGHFPGNPVVLGVIIVEAMAQVGGILIYKSFESKLLGLTPALVGIDNVKFKAPTVPGDKLTIEATLIKKKLNIFKLSAQAFNLDKLVVQSNITATVMSK